MIDKEKQVTKWNSSPKITIMKKPYASFLLYDRGDASLKQEHNDLNKGNSSIPLFETHKSIKKNPGYKLKLRGNALNIRGKQRHNRNTTLKCNTHRNRTKY